MSLLSCNYADEQGEYLFVRMWGRTCYVAFLVNSCFLG